MTSLTELKEEAQRHYTLPLRWTDLPHHGGSAWADVDHHTVSVMVEPPAGNPQIVRIQGGRQEALKAVGPVDMFASAFQMAMKL
jgi:hypothetical protein